MNDKQKYEQVLKRAKDLLDDMDKGDYFASKADIENIFPELKKSEGERIVKCLLNYFNHVRYSGIDLKGTNVDEVLTWLEKQGNKIVDCKQNHQDVKYPNGGIVMEDFNGGEGFYKLHLDYLNKKQVKEVEEMVRTWNKESNTPNENIINCIGMCLTDANEQRFKDYDTNLKDCLKWLEKQGEQEPIDYNEELKKCRESYLYFLDKYVKFEKRKPALSKEDERIRKGLIKAVSGILKDNTLYGTDVTREEALTWLEKQGENKSVDKPKFKVGDWITDGHLTCKVLSVTGKFYELHLYNDDYCHFETDVQSVDKRYHLWTIADAKDGDVLVTPPEEGSESNEQIFLFKAINSRDYVDNCIEYYGRLCDDRFYKNKTGYMGTILDTFYPATKEQRVLFFQKMKEANYVWNVYNKELTKIEQQTVDKAESKFHEGDLIVINETTYQIAEIDNSHVVLSLNGRECNFGLDVLDNAHFWTIEDAKDGDVLVCNINKAEIGGDVEKLPNMTPTICIYQNVVKDSEYIHSYCSLYDENSLVLQNTMYYNAFVYNIHPATKEQRDLLFQKMKEAGFIWDAKTKEVKEIESKSSIADVPSRELILSIWDLGNEWKELTNGCILPEYGTQLDYIQKHWYESEYYLKATQYNQSTGDVE